MAAACRRERRQTGVIASRQQHASAGIAHEATATFRNGCPGGGSYSEHRNAQPFALGLLRRRLVARVAAVGQDQQITLGEAGVSKQIRRLFDRAIGALPLLGQGVVIQRCEQRLHGVAVIGQWRNGERIASVGDQRHLPIATLAQQIGQLEACAGQSIRCHIGGTHVLGQIKRDDQR